MTTSGHEPERYTMFYVQVNDIQAPLDKAIALEGRRFVPLVNIPTDIFARMADPDGNAIGLLKPALWTRQGFCGQGLFPFFL